MRERFCADLAASSSPLLPQCHDASVASQAELHSRLGSQGSPLEGAEGVKGVNYMMRALLRAAFLETLHVAGRLSRIEYAALDRGFLQQALRLAGVMLL